MHSPLWSVTVWGLVSSSRLVASIADWGKKMQNLLIQKKAQKKGIKVKIRGIKTKLTGIKTKLKEK